MALQAHHWLVAFLTAVLLHAALALALVPRSSSLPKAEPVAIVLELGTSGDGRAAGGDGQPGGLLNAVGPAADEPVFATEASANSQAALTTAVTVNEASAAEDETKEATTPPETAQRPIPATAIAAAAEEPITPPAERPQPIQAKIQPAPAPKQTSKRETVKAQPKPAPTAKAEPKPEPKPQPTRRPEPKPKPNASATTAKRDSDPPAPPRTRAPTAKPPNAASASVSGSRKGQGTRSGSGHSASQDAQGAGRGSGSGRGSSSESGSGSGSGRGSGSASAANYSGRLASWLNRHKRYPAQARRQRAQGTVKVRFTIDRNGRLLSHQIVSSSGHRLLDQEAEAMLKRASPMPAIPAELNRSRLTVTLPVNFSLR